MKKAGVTDVLPEIGHTALLRARLTVFLNLAAMQHLLTSRTRLVARQVMAAVGPTHEREIEALRRLAAMIEVHKCGALARHVNTEATYVQIIAQCLGMPEPEVDVLALAAPLHDIGEIAVSDGILQKRGKLTHHERVALSRHPQLGHDLLKQERSKYLRMASEIALHHHERYDGSGYPHGVAAEAIPLSARIVAVGSVFVALTSSRPFRHKGWSVRKAADYLQAEAGKAFDPTVVAAFTARLARAPASH
jgi:response regulator RpfG family c-di-GMP phosphodiesterase